MTEKKKKKETMAMILRWQVWISKSFSICSCEAYPSTASTLADSNSLDFLLSLDWALFAADQSTKRLFPPISVYVFSIFRLLSGLF